MFKSLFSKYITAFTAIIAVSFLILVLAMSSMVSNYSIDTKKTLMDSSARYTSEIIDTYRVFDNTGFSGTVEKYASRIRDALDFPPYYGMNLDALFDMLTTESRPLRLVVCYPADPCEALRAYWPRLLRVFDNAALENERLQVIYREQ